MRFLSPIWISSCPSGGSIRKSSTGGRCGRRSGSIESSGGL